MRRHQRLQLLRIGFHTLDPWLLKKYRLPSDKLFLPFLAGLTLSYLEIFWRKYMYQKLVSMIFVPLLSLVPAVILWLTLFLGPIGWTGLARLLSSGVVLAGLTGPVKWLFGAIFGAIYAPFVITGLHHMTNAIDT